MAGRASGKCHARDCGAPGGFVQVDTAGAEVVGRITALETESDRLSSLDTRKLAALSELKRSLLHQAFTGQL